MDSKVHNIGPCGPSLLVKPAGNGAGDKDPIAGPCAEQAGNELADENCQDASGAPQASPPKRRHIGARSGSSARLFDAATTPAARQRLSKPELAVTMRVPSASRVTPVNDCLCATFGDCWERFTRDGSEKVRDTDSTEVAAYMPARSDVGIAPDLAAPGTLLSAAGLAIELKMPQASEEIMKEHSLRGGSVTASPGPELPIERRTNARDLNPQKAKRTTASCARSEMSLTGPSLVNPPSADPVSASSCPFETPPTSRDSVPRVKLSLV